MQYQMREVYSYSIIKYVVQYQMREALPSTE